MFDFAWSEIALIGVVALVLIGPKDLPVLLRTVGKYLAVVRRHTAKFRARFDEVLREAELQDLKLQIEGVGRQINSPLSGAAIEGQVRERVVCGASSLSRHSAHNTRPSCSLTHSRQ